MNDSQRKHETEARGELARLRRIFDMLDNDKDGKIPLRDFRSQFSSDNSPKDLSNGQKESLLRKADKNEDGEMNFREFALLTSSSRADGSMFRKILYKIAGVTLADSDKPEVYSYLDQYTCCPPPIFMLIVSIVEVAVFIYYTTKEGLVPGWFNGCGGCVVDGQIGPLVFAPEYRNEAWRFVSYMFVHAGFQHILGNVVLQLILGLPLELVHTFIRIAPLYLAGVILGSMLQYILDPNVWLVGASGGVYALLTAHLANLILNWADMRFRWWRLFAVLAYMGVDVGFALYRRFALDSCDRVSYTSHIGGAVAGILLGVALLKNVHQFKWEKIVKWSGLSLFLLVMVIGIILVIVIKPGSDALLSTMCIKPTSAP